MSKSIHQQIIDATGKITLEGEEIEFTLPHCMTIAKDALQDANELVEIYKDAGILLNVFHQAFGQMRVNWSADVKKQAIIKEKDETGKVIGEENIFAALESDCSIEWIPPVQGIPKSKKQDLTGIIIKLVGLGYDANILLLDADKLAEACEKEGIKLR